MPLQLLASILFGFAEAATSMNRHELIEEVRVQNPEIQAAQARFEASRPRTTSFYYLLDPWIGIEFGKDLRIYSITQEFPFLTKLKSRSTLAEYEAEAYYYEYEAKAREIVKRTSTAYARLLLIEKEIEMMREVKSIVGQMRAIANRNYALNMVTQTDALRAQVELLKMDNQLVNLDNEKSLVITELNLLLNRAPDRPLAIKTQVESDPEMPLLDTLYELAKRNQPILRSLRNRIRMAQASVSIARQEYIPDLMVKFETEEMEMHLENPRFMIGLTIPLWFYGRQSNMVKEMRAELRMAEAEYQAMENMAFNMVKEAQVKSQNYMREIGLYRNTIIPQVEATFKAALRSYEANRVDFAMLLESQKMLIETRLAYFRAQTNLMISLADLEAGIAQELKER